MKRFFDFTFSIFCLIIVTIPILFIYFLLAITSDASPIFWSSRVGANNKIFMMPKFRTMKVGTPEVATEILSNPNAHITIIGSLLRKSSLDELPQIWSILKGDMSFVGPRPALFNQIDLIMLRNESGISGLLPGLTGWAQINGRDNLSIKKKVDLDIEYFNRQSFLFDLKIIGRTIINVIFSENVLH